MDLHTGSLYWPQTLAEVPSYPPLQADIECEVVIVGGGCGGALLAHYLMKKQISTVLLEKKTISSGSSSANTGLLQYANDKPLTACMHTFGAEYGLRVYELCRQAVADLGQIAAELPLDVQYRQRPSLYFATCEADVPKLRKEYELLAHSGFPVEYLESEQIERRFGFRKPGAMYSQGDAEINPFRLAAALVQQAHEQGMRVYEQTEVLHHTFDGAQVTLHTRGHKIKARKVVFATGYETQRFHRNPNAVLSSSYAIVTQPVCSFADWPDRCLIWETARPYLYMRTTVDNRIIAGGLDEALTAPEQRDPLLAHKREILLAEVRKLFPAIPELRADYSWCATFGGTHDGLPLIGEQSGFPGCYFLLGYGGNGTVYATFGAQIITALITDGRHPDAELFAFDRSPSGQGVPM
ncbi:FAD-binding oxidoreductase [Paenibacillus athensensis]|uniref:Amino acid oxidase n=1 Tax=Paenibacillus athensensis TaxID=1967502 RepID=A0A4Y8Q3K6_9BACL|nr:FAD-dependent oxidoreductase [Paenibacillus athensensis]MCD1258673.1 FAD-binding oxidoreductase [Paenibacillus athensensis]